MCVSVCVRVCVRERECVRECGGRKNDRMAGLVVGKVLSIEKVRAISPPSILTTYWSESTLSS